MIFYFGFQITFIIHRLAIKFFFGIRTDLIPNSIILHPLFSQIIHPFSLIITTFYVSSCLRKHDMQWLNFMIIIQVHNKVLTVFLAKRNLVRCLYFFNICIFWKNMTIMTVRFIFFQFHSVSILPNVKFTLSIFYIWKSFFYGL